ncbi:MAG: UDP-N-acetylglucosamine 1-carboxyvinyltransferase, partial [Owenweeksia sp.]
MGTFQIKGGKKLKGEIVPQGAKNEALQIICATLLTPEKVTISNIPDILDVNKLIDILSDLGVTVHRNGPGNYTFQADNLNLAYLESDTFKDKGASLR